MGLFSMYARNVVIRENPTNLKNVCILQELLSLCQFAYKEIHNLPSSVSNINLN